MRMYIDELLSPWNNESMSSHEKNAKQSVRKIASKNTLSVYPLSRKTLLNYSNQKFRSSKWYGRDESKTKYTFQHHTDVARYMEEYRNDKLRKLAVKNDDVDTDNKPELEDSSVSAYENACMGLRLGDKNYPIFLQQSNTDEIIMHGYQVEGKKQKNIDRSDQHPRKEGEEKIAHTIWNDGKRKATLPNRNILSLPRCDTVSSNTSRCSDHLRTENMLICHKFGGLSLNSPTNQSSPSDSGKKLRKLRPRAIQKSVKQDANGWNKLSNGVKCNDYNQIIKRVLGRFDPSNNTVCSAVAEDCGLKCSSYLLATT